jgi:S-DNA-T family DNA segregation ATPase FtsK/SpoIIIE
MVQASAGSSKAYAILGTGFAILFATAMYSYSPRDPSFLNYAYPQRTTSNLVGWFGANISATTLFLFGILGYALPLLLGWQFVRSLRGNSTGNWKNWFSLTWIVVSFCVLSQQLLAPVGISPTPYSTGGLVGKLATKQLIKLFGYTGNLVLWMTIALAAVATYNSVFCRVVSQKFLHLIKANLLALKDFIVGIFARTSQPQPVHQLPRSSPKAEPKINRPDEADQEPVWDDEPVPSVPKARVPSIRKVVAQLPIELHSTPEKSTADYNPPAHEFFRAGKSNGVPAESHTELEKRATQIVSAFNDFGVTGQVTAIQPGPVVTVFEFEPDAGTKLSRILALIDDIAMALRVESVFIFPAKGKRAIAVQVPNTKRETVLLGDIIRSKTFLENESPLTIAMGKSLSGEPVCADLAAMPHLLTAGATGSGKSVAINALLSSLIAKSSPDQVRMILVDPKMLELSVYEGIPHLLMPVITDPSKASLALKWATCEMERRYRLMQIAKVRHITGFNQHWTSASGDEKQRIQLEMNDESISTLPYIVLVIDELADLMLTAPKDVETSIQRLAQKARASGIHLVLATQRPSVDIITGVIKANLPCRIAFQTVSRHDSRTILDQIGADKLLGKGDLLFMRPGTSRLERIQGAFVQDDEVLKFIEWIKSKYPASYDDRIMQWIDREFERQKDDSVPAPEGDFASEDPVFEQAIGIASSQGYISASYLQRQLKIGYNRAARIVETMEARGLVSKADGAKPRQWLGAG